MTDEEEFEIRERLLELKRLRENLYCLIYETRYFKVQKEYKRNNERFFENYFKVKRKYFLDDWNFEIHSAFEDYIGRKTELSSGEIQNFDNGMLYYCESFCRFVQECEIYATHMDILREIQELLDKLY